VKRYFILAGIILAATLALYILVEAVRIPLLVNPIPSMSRAGPFAPLLSITLLTVDVILPVPASLIMIANGALFGVAFGALVSMLGSIGAAMFGFYLGRRGSSRIERLIPPGQRERGDAFLKRWGDVAVIVTRPIPMVAETMAVLAGTSPMTWKRLILATVVGSAPAAVFYALLGAAAATSSSTVWVIFLALLLVAVLWLAGRRLILKGPQSERAAN
jgi:uncharacterized membrane protein YdjX (TVP38/TMEM64 family)